MQAAMGNHCTGSGVLLATWCMLQPIATPLSPPLAQPVEDAAAVLAAALAGLEAADWLEAVKALNLLRQLVVHHPDACVAQL